MKALRIIVPGAALAIASVARAVYAPIPEEEKGKDLVVSVDSGVTYDTNIFGAPSGAIHSVVYELTPDFKFNATPTAQTFISAEYQLELDDFQNRPGSKIVDSNTVNARLAHAFSKVTTLDLNDSFQQSHNPASLLNGVAVNADQSSIINEMDGRFTTSISQDAGLVLKARGTDYDYTNPAIGDTLNRWEDLYGLEANYSLSSDLKAAAEVRHEDIRYEHSIDSNDKESEFAMGGFDYSPGAKVSLSSRLGGEWRERSDGSSTSGPYAEFSARYDYERQSYVSAGYMYTLAEASNPVDYHDEQVNRLFATVQHALSAMFVASASVDYEPSRLNGRSDLPVPVADLHETTTHTGAALSYVNGHWTVSATYDYDFVDSDQFARGMDRSRTGLRASVTF